MVPTRRTCKCVLSTCENVGKICGSVRGEYRLSTDLRARRHAVARLVHEDLSLRSGHGFTPSTDDARVLYRQRAHNAQLREFCAIFPTVTCSTDGALSTCVVRAYAALPQFNCPMSTHNSRGQYRVSTCTALTTHLQRTLCALINNPESLRCHGRHLEAAATATSGEPRKVVLYISPLPRHRCGKTHIHRTCTHLQRAREYGHRK